MRGPSTWGVRRCIANAAVRGFGGGKKKIEKGGTRVGNGEDAQQAAGEERACVEALAGFETPLRIVKYPHRSLRAENARVCFPGGGPTRKSSADLSSVSERLPLLAREMLRVMYETDGVGLAAPQVGVNLRMMVYNPEGDPASGEEYVLLNPVIVGQEKKTTVFEEGCLSFPGVYGDVVVRSVLLFVSLFGLGAAHWHVRPTVHNAETAKRRNRTPVPDDDDTMPPLRASRTVGMRNIYAMPSFEIVCRCVRTCGDQHHIVEGIICDGELT